MVKKQLYTKCQRFQKESKYNWRNVSYNTGCVKFPSHLKADDLKPVSKNFSVLHFPKNVTAHLL